MTGREESTSSPTDRTDGPGALDTGSAEPVAVRRVPALVAALADARDLPDGPGRLVALERLADRADAAGDVRSAMDARFALIEAYLLHGERWRLVEPVRRCRAAADHRPELIDSAEAGLLLRYQRYAVEALLGTPRVGLDQTRSLLDDLAHRVGADGPDASTVAELRCRIADHLGDEPGARHWYQRWAGRRPGPTGGCPGCAPARRAELLAGWGEWRAALTELRECADEPEDCTDQPERALVAGLLPNLRAGEPERAAAAHVRAYRRHRHERAAFPHLAAHLRFCALGGHLDRGLAIMTEQLPRLDRPTDDLAAMEFAAAGALVCGLAVEAGLGDRVVPRPAYGDRPPTEPDVATLGALLLGVASELAGSFDARNGTGHHSGRMAAWLAERPLADPVPLPGDDEHAEDPGDRRLDEPGADGARPADGLGETELATLTLDMITAALDRRGDRYLVDEGGTVVGRWGAAVIQFRRAGERGEVLHTRAMAVRRLPVARRAEAYAFCNAWNHDRLLPKAYAHDLGEELVLAGDVATDLAHGVAAAQLLVLVDAAIATGVAYAEAVAALP
ncbi:YbjN domain-containing protein [Micromonospora acroterricola]|uniref:YbjN domain-containing protein n=1 Tax=Micromonospora acroterricola TaxID=2202421 RepID=A0A317CRE0_9ACTN|nr:YbjN domain-containing protein [Micromonospora acroterricola]PWR04710.1 YbjN domain-containing protein [Micromonospora acroterricola]